MVIAVVGAVVVELVVVGLSVEAKRRNSKVCLSSPLSSDAVVVGRVTSMKSYSKV